MQNEIHLSNLIYALPIIANFLTKSTKPDASFFFYLVFLTTYIKKELIKKKSNASCWWWKKAKNLKVQCNRRHFLVSVTKASHCLVLKGQWGESLSLSILHCKVVFLSSPPTRTMLMQIAAYSVTKQHLNLFNGWFCFTEKSWSLSSPGC